MRGFGELAEKGKIEDTNDNFPRGRRRSRFIGGGDPWESKKRSTGNLWETERTA